MRVILYTRVSTDRQAEHGLGLQVQEKAIRAWVKSNGHKIVAAYSDSGVSGSNGLDTRKGLAQAFSDLEAHQAEALVVYRLDRLARKLSAQETWIEQLAKAGAQVISVTEPEVGEDEMRVLVRQILGSIAEYERAVIRKRMQSGRAAKAEQGGYAGYGSPAFGQKAEARELAGDQAEQEVIGRMSQMKAAGMSVRAITAQLNAEGIPSKRGGAWHPQTVARVLGRLEAAR